jgi:hypothetical protein
VELVKKHTEFKELSVLLLNKFIEKVIVHEADKSSGKWIQKVDIHLNFIGNFKLFESEVPQKELPTKLSKGRKPRCLMTEEEREKLHEDYRERYAKKKATRLAKEQARRAEILTGTSFGNSRQRALRKVPKLLVNYETIQQRSYQKAAFDVAALFH